MSADKCNNVHEGRTPLTELGPRGEDRGLATRRRAIMVQAVAAVPVPVRIVRPRRETMDSAGSGRSTGRWRTRSTCMSSRSAARPSLSRPAAPARSTPSRARPAPAKPAWPAIRSASIAPATGRNGRIDHSGTEPSLPAPRGVACIFCRGTGRYPNDQAALRRLHGFEGTGVPVGTPANRSPPSPSQPAAAPAGG